MKRILNLLLFIGLASVTIAQQKPDYQQTHTPQVLSNYSGRFYYSFGIPYGANLVFPAYVSDTSKRGSLYMKNTGSVDQLQWWDTHANRDLSAEIANNRTAVVTNSTVSYPNWYGITHYGYPKTHIDSIIAGLNNDLKLYNPIYENYPTVPYQYAPPVSNAIWIGDSITAGYLAPNTWAVDLASLYNISTYSNLAISGTGVRKQYSQMATASLGVQKTSKVPLLSFVGFNNTRVLTGQAIRYETINAAHRAMASVQFTKKVYFPSSAPIASLFTFSQAAAPGLTEAILIDWGSRSMFFRKNDVTNTGANYWNKSSVVANETATITIPSEANAIAIGTWGCDGTIVHMSRIQISVDGVVKTTYDPNGRTYTGFTDGFSQDGIINDAIIIRGLGMGQHTVELKFLDGGLRGAFDYVASLKTPTESQQVPMYVLDLPHMNSTGYNYPGGETTQAILDGASASRKATLQSNFPGYAIGFVDINATGYYDPSVSSQINSDGIHPTDVGQQLIANRVAYYMNSGSYIRNNGGSSANLSAGSGLAALDYNGYSPVTITNNLITGLAGGQTIVGGTGVSDVLNYKSTTGNGTLTSIAHQWLTGNNGGTVAGLIRNNGNWEFGRGLMASTTNPTPGSPLFIQDSQGDMQTFYSTTATGVQVNAYNTGANGFRIIQRGNATLSLWTNGQERFTINGTGAVGILATAPTHHLTLGLGNTGFANYYNGAGLDNGVTNWSRVTQSWKSGTYTFLSEAGGTGAVQPAAIVVGNNTFAIGTTSTNNSFSFTGANGGFTAANYFRVGGVVVNSGTGFQSIFNLDPDIQQNGTTGGGFSILYLNPNITNANVAAARNLIDAGINVSGTHVTKFAVDITGAVSIGSFATGIAGTDAILVNHNGVIGSISSSTLTPVNTYSTSATPSISAGVGAGTSPTLSIQGSNQDGLIVLTAGTTPVAGAIATITLSGSFAYPNPCAPVISANGSTAILVQSNIGIGATTTSTWVLYAQAPLVSGTLYQWTYHNGGY